MQSELKISITFTDFLTEPTYDVSIYDGLLETSDKLLLSASGYDLPSSSVITSGNSCLIRFVTDGAYNFKGRKLDYISV